MQPTHYETSLINSLSPREREKLLSSLTEQESAALLYEWKYWARPKQIAPEAFVNGEAVGWLIMAGRGFGKTRTGAEIVRQEVESGRSGRIGIIAETSADGKDVIVNGESGILETSPPWFMPKFVSSTSSGRPKLTWPNGAIATLYDAREPDQLRGPQHDFVWMDELAKYRYAQAVFDQILFGLRLGKFPRWMATTTPRPIRLINELVADDSVVVTVGSSDENIENLAQTYQKNVIDRYRGTRLGRQEIDAEILNDVPGALWTRRNLDEHRVDESPSLKRVVIGVDPPATSHETSNEAGIIAAGVDVHDEGYVLDDWSLRGTPEEWGRRAVALYRYHDADCIVAECNQGGEMVESVIRSVDPNVNVKLVRATRGKYVRAEPASALYEQGRIHHVGMFAELEDQMIVFTPESSLDRTEGSPDRVDGLVWALTDLFKIMTKKEKKIKPKDDYVPKQRGWMG